MTLKQIGILVGLFIAGVAVGRFTLPAKIVEKEKIVYKDKIVEKKVFVKDTKQKNNIVTVRLVTIHPDGTKTIETKTYDKSEIEISQTKTDDKTEETTSTKTVEKTVEYKKNDWIFTFNLKVKPEDYAYNYGIGIDRRILGPFYAGGFIFTDGNFGANIGVSF